MNLHPGNSGILSLKIFSQSFNKFWKLTVHVNAVNHNFGFRFETVEITLFRTKLKTEISWRISAIEASSMKHKSHEAWNGTGSWRILSTLRAMSAKETWRRIARYSAGSSAQKCPAAQLNAKLTRSNASWFLCQPLINFQSLQKVSRRPRFTNNN